MLKYGGKFYEFNEEESSEYMQIYNWLIPCHFKTGSSSGTQTIYLEANTVSVKKILTVDQYFFYYLMVEKWSILEKLP